MAGDIASLRSEDWANRPASRVRTVSHSHCVSSAVSPRLCRGFERESDFTRTPTTMNSALLVKAMNESKLLFAAIFVLMFGFPLVFLRASGMISLPAFSEFLTNALPRSWQRVWGVPISQVATPAGRAALVFVHPLVMSSGVVWAITRGSDCVSGEIGRGTMEMLLAQPVRR